MSAFDIPLEEAPQKRGLRASRTVSLLVAFLAVAGGTGGTWAAFTASTSNGASVSTGTLILSNDVEEAGACFSTDEGDAVDENIGACDELFELDVQAPGDEDSTRVTLKHEGNVDAAALELFASGLCTTSDAVSTGFHGDDSDICDDVQFMVQEYSSLANQGSDTRTGGSCRYGLDIGLDGQCDGFDASRTLQHFVTTYPDFNQPVGLGAMPAADTRWFRVFVKLDPAATNDVQGRLATFGVTWRAVQ